MELLKLKNTWRGNTYLAFTPSITSLFSQPTRLSSQYASLTLKSV